jgi:hypothetical protein
MSFWFETNYCVIFAQLIVNQSTIIMEKKYGSLSFIASCISFLSYIILFVAFIEFLVVVGGAEVVNSIRGDFPELADIFDFLHTAIDVSALAALIWSVLIFIFIKAISESINLFIDIEHNSRETTYILKKIEVLLERKFDMKSEEPEPEPTIFGEISKLINKIID